MPEEDDFQRREALRYKKAKAWLEDPLTPLRLTVACILSHITNRALGRFFKDSAGRQALQAIGYRACFCGSTPSEPPWASPERSRNTNRTISKPPRNAFGN
eukprot:6676826-Alexandrium_andersonii.AAC.1